MHRKNLIAVVAAGFIGMSVYGGSGAAFAHEGHDNGRAVAQGAAAKKVDNELCPVTGEKIDPKSNITYTYKGKVYRFCCAGCIADFKKDPEKYIRKMRDEGAPAEPVHRAGHDHD